MKLNTILESFLLPKNEDKEDEKLIKQLKKLFFLDNKEFQKALDRINLIRKSENLVPLTWEKIKRLENKDIDFLRRFSAGEVDKNNFIKKAKLDGKLPIVITGKSLESAKLFLKSKNLENIVQIENLDNSRITSKTPEIFAVADKKYLEKLLSLTNSNFIILGND